MNITEFIVEEVIEAPKKIIYSTPSKKEYVWWEIIVSYFDDMGELKLKKLTFDTEEKIREVKRYYEFYVPLEENF